MNNQLENNFNFYTWKFDRFLGGGMGDRHPGQQTVVLVPSPVFPKFAHKFRNSRNLSKILRA